MTTKPGDITKAAIVADSNIDVIQWNQNLNFHAKKAIKTAEEFIPTVGGNWTTAPVTQDDALNELGARVSVGNDVANLVTLTGVAVDSVNLGTFTGSTIADNVVIKAALQALETSVELKAVKSASSHTVVFARFGLGITSVTLTGLAVNDIVILLTPGTGLNVALSVAPVVTINTLPTDPADTDFLVVLRPVV
jgi:hypothetical protein